MAVSVCAKCGGFDFEAVERQPAGLERTLLFVQCAFCGVVVGVVEPARPVAPAPAPPGQSR